MRELSSTFRQAVYEGNRNYQCRAEITLLDDTELEITNANIMLGGIEISDAVTSDNSFDALGSVIINAISITLDNSSDTYSQYDFYGASVVFYMGLEDIEEICIGTYSIDDTSYNNATIVLYCLDNMVKFDKPYSDSSLTYPATLYTIVTDICTVCGVPLDSDYSQFPHYNYTISTRPDDIALTCREVLSFVVSMCGCFAKCNSDGELQIKWFNTSELNIAGIDGGIFDSSTPYATGDSVNGGTMSPWSTGDVADGGTFTDVNGLHYISALASQEIATDDVTITGVKITIQNQVVDADSSDEPIIDYLSGTADYTVSISNNPFLTADNAQTVADWLATDLVGLTFRPLSVTHLDDLSIEAGDVALVLDRKGNVYKTLITNVLFKINSYETSKCSAESIPKKAGTRYSVEEKNYAVTKVLVEKASTTATKYITDITNGIFVSPEGQGPNDTQTPTGWRIKDALELIKSGVTYIKMWLDNSVPKVQIGVADALNVLIDSADIKLRNNSTDLALFGSSSARIGKTNDIHTTIGSNSFAISAPYNLNILNVYGEQVNNQRALLISGTSDQSQVSASIPADVKIIISSQIIVYAKKLSDSSYTASATFTYGTADSKTSNGYTFAYNGAKTFTVSKTSSVGDINITFRAAELSNCKFILGTLASSPVSSGNNIFSFGSNNVVQGNNAIAFGSDCTASGNWAVAIGWQAQATYQSSFAFQRGQASALYSLAAGDGQAKKKYSVAFGEDTVANGEHQVVLGKFNVADTSSLLIVGNGTSERSNAFKLSSGGSGYFASALGTGGKTAWNDTNKGCWLTSNGNIHLMDSATSGGAIGFHYNLSASATTTLYENASGVLTCTGTLYSKSADGISRPSVNTDFSDGKKVAYLTCYSANQLGINGQWTTTGTTYTTKIVAVSTSDIRLKKNVEDCEVEDALSVINQIKLHSFDWLHTNEHQKIGFIADELEQIDPKLSMGGRTEKDGTINYKSVDTFYMMGYLVKAIQEQQKQIQQLQAEITELKKGGTQ